MDKQQQTIVAYKTIFPTEHGKLVLENLSTLCGEKLDLFDKNSERQTSYNLGAISVIAHIRYMMTRKIEPTQKTVISKRRIL